MTRRLRPLALVTTAVMLAPVVLTVATASPTRTLPPLADLTSSAVAFDAGTGRLFVVNLDSDTVDVLDTQAVLLLNDPESLPDPVSVTPQVSRDATLYLERSRR